MNQPTLFGKLPDGQAIYQYQLKNSQGVTLGFLNYGGIVNYLRLTNNSLSVVVGFPDLPSYLANTSYLGALIGRYANRIHMGQFDLNETTYSLAQNNDVNHLHGGVKGFDKCVWKVEMISEQKAILSYKSMDGEEGYPGNLGVNVSYELTELGEWEIEYEAVCDQDTIINLTQHSYFNLEGGGSIYDHELRILADSYIPIENGIPLKTAPEKVDQTPFDLRKWTKLGEGISSDHPQIIRALGFDHTFIRKEEGIGALALVAEARGTSGLTMQVFSTEPSVQLFTANYPINGVGVSYPKHSAFCLETQHYPDSPNRHDFPTTVLKAGEIFHSKTSYKWL